MLYIGLPQLTLAWNLNKNNTSYFSDSALLLSKCVAVIQNFATVDYKFSSAPKEMLFLLFLSLFQLCKHFHVSQVILVYLFKLVAELI